MPPPIDRRRPTKRRRGASLAAAPDAAPEPSAVAESGARAVAFAAAALRLSPEVAEALAAGRPLVALESTIFAHGFPPAEGRALCDDLEQAVRAEGAVPAAIAICAGEVRVGLDPAAYDTLTGQAAAGASGRPQVAKCGAREVAFVAAAGGWGATTVSATLAIAARAGIAVFATGGIGGVHRGGEVSLDISADLDALASWPVLVVAAGAKSVLDLPRTVEALETRGVPVVGYRCDELPAFYSAHSGLRLGLRCDEPDAVARGFDLQRQLGTAAGALICQPPPAAVALAADEVEVWLAQASAAADSAGVGGAAWTPFVLAELHRRSGGRTLVVNRALALANAALAARVAVALAAIAAGARGRPGSHPRRR